MVEPSSTSCSGKDSDAEEQGGIRVYWPETSRVDFEITESESMTRTARTGQRYSKDLEWWLGLLCKKKKSITIWILNQE